MILSRKQQNNFIKFYIVDIEKQKTRRKMNTEQLKNMLASYGRSVLGAATALYMAGVTDPADLAYSLLAAIIPVALRAINPNDPAFGIVPSAEAVEKAAKAAKPLKAPVKKPAAKKAVAAKKPVNKKK
jgi:hypothetical protein